jgi:hypothetical protein
VKKVARTDYDFDFATPDPRDDPSANNANTTEVAVDRDNTPAIVNMNANDVDSHDKGGTSDSPMDISHNGGIEEEGMIPSASLGDTTSDNACASQPSISNESSAASPIDLTSPNSCSSESGHATEIAAGAGTSLRPNSHPEDLTSLATGPHAHESSATLLPQSSSPSTGRPRLSRISEKKCDREKSLLEKSYQEVINLIKGKLQQEDKPDSANELLQQYKPVWREKLLSMSQARFETFWVRVQIEIRQFERSNTQSRDWSFLLFGPQYDSDAWLQSGWDSYEIV